MKITIADKQTIVRIGMIGILKDHFKTLVVDEVSDFTALTESLKANKPELLILDFEQVDSFNITNLPDIHELSPTTRIMVLTNDENEEDILKVLELGIQGYLLKDTSYNEFISAIEAVLKNGKYYCSKVIDMLYNKHISKPIQKPISEIPQELTPKELEIIRLIAEGRITKEIAEILFISVHTVNTHRKNIFKKLNIKNSSELIMLAIKKGIVDTTEYYI